MRVRGGGERSGWRMNYTGALRRLYRERVEREGEEGVTKKRKREKERVGEKKERLKVKGDM